jgi:hypothetical protein
MQFRMLASDGRIYPMSNLSTGALAARARAPERWYVYLILCRRGAIYHTWSGLRDHCQACGSFELRGDVPRQVAREIIDESSDGGQ